MILTIPTGKMYNTGSNIVPINDSLAAWYDASDESTMLNIGDTWFGPTDKSGNGNDFGIAGNGGPNYGTTFQNGLNTIQFDVSSAYSVTSSALTNFPTTDVTIFSMMKNESLSLQSTNWGSFTDGANRFQTYAPYGPNSVYWDFGNIGGGGRLDYYEPDWNTDIFDLWTMSAESGVGMKISRNGELKASNSTTSTYDPTGHDFRMGDNFIGEFAEIIIYNRALTSTEIAYVERYLMQKWFGLPVMNGLTDWYDGADESTFTLTGTDVDQWDSKTPNNFNMTATNKPTRVHPAIQLNGTSNYMTHSNPQTYLDGTLIVAGHGAVLNNSKPLVSYSTPSAAIKVNQYPNTGKVGYTEYGTADRVSTVDSPSDGKMGVFITTDATNEFRIIMDRTDEDTLTLSNGYGIPFGELGRRWGSSSDFMGVHIQEIINYNRVLSDDEIHFVTNYLNDKYRMGI